MNNKVLIACALALCLVGANGIAATADVGKHTTVSGGTGGGVTVATTTDKGVRTEQLNVGAGKDTTYVNANGTPEASRSVAPAASGTGQTVTTNVNGASSTEERAMNGTVSPEADD